VAARQTAPVIGALCKDGSEGPQVAKPSTWHSRLQVSFGYRYQSSSRHFIGTDEQTQREVNHNQIENDYHLFDVSLSYQLTPRWSLNGSAPFLIARRDQLYNPRGVYHVESVGDITLGARRWMFRPPTESGGNVALGFSLKLPTGTYDATDHAVNSKGQPIIATADQSIQAGDGAFGFALDTQAYKPIWFHTMMYFSGGYLFNPQETNGVRTFRTRPHEQVMSVADQYLFRGGLSHRVPRLRGFAASIGGRIEGVPVHDAFGGSDGFRRPGYAISIDPGLMFSRWDQTFAVNVPWAVERNRSRSVPDIYNGTHGDAAFADYALILSYSRQF
jgi:hypothetical protein